MICQLLRWCALGILLMSVQAAVAAPWGKDYFPNTRLINQDGEEALFFDDLIEGKIVAINFIYTSCPDVCPLETAQLTRVQNILGDRVGKDVHFYSISIDPEVDTPQVLAAYRKQFKANWDFFTGDKSEIIELRRKLGLYIDGADDGNNKNNHNVSMIIGNQSTGRWMQRSPFENPYVLADQIGNWLDSWKSPQSNRDYASAPDLREMVRGETLFRTRCSSCHSVNGETAPSDIGPDLYGVTERRETKWLVEWMRAPDKMLAANDPLALSLVAQYDGLVMPNLRLNQQEVGDLLFYMDNLPAPMAALPSNNIEQDSVAVMNAWVRTAVPGATVQAGYMTLINAADAPVTLVAASSPDFQRVEFHEMSTQDGMMQMKALDDLLIPAGDKLVFSTGGKHLMLHGAKRQFVRGDAVRVVLEFDGGMTQALSLRVK